MRAKKHGRAYGHNKNQLCVTQRHVFVREFCGGGERVLVGHCHGFVRRVLRIYIRPVCACTITVYPLVKSAPLRSARGTREGWS